VSEQEYLELVALLDKARADVVGGDATHPYHESDYEMFADARDAAVRLSIYRRTGHGYLAPLPPVTPESIRA
jgi:hypothetical protein